MMEESSKLKSQIELSRNNAVQFIDALKVNNGYKYTVNHNFEQQPAALLYGTWAAACTKTLMLGAAQISDEEKAFFKEALLKDRQKDGTFLPQSLRDQKPAKSFEYLKLHCSNYATGAMMELFPDFDFQSSFFDAYLDADYLARWLDQRALNRPWEESNNIVNVASYLALCNDHGNQAGKERLYQMLEWHNKVQNPKIGGFENFGPKTRKNILQSMAGAVHNFHIHLYLKEPFNFEQKIAQNVIAFLYEGPLTACLSIDFVELAVRTIKFLPDPQPLISALMFHLEALLSYQNEDGGWYENETSRPTLAAGMREKTASSCSYATWFRLCSIGMIAITLLGDQPENWHFRKTLGMGYAPNYWDQLEPQSLKIDQKAVFKSRLQNTPYKLKDQALRFLVKVRNKVLR